MFKDIFKGTKHECDVKKLTKNDSSNCGDGGGRVHMEEYNEFVIVIS